MQQMRPFIYMKYILNMHFRKNIYLIWDGTEEDPKEDPSINGEGGGEWVDICIQILQLPLNSVIRQTDTPALNTVSLKRYPKSRTSVWLWGISSGPHVVLYIMYLLEAKTHSAVRSKDMVKTTLKGRFCSASLWAGLDRFNLYWQVSVHNVCIWWLHCTHTQTYEKNISR